MPELPPILSEAELAQASRPFVILHPPCGVMRAQRLAYAAQAKHARETQEQRRKDYEAAVQRNLEERVTICRSIEPLIAELIQGTHAKVKAKDDGVVTVDYQARDKRYPGSKIYDVQLQIHVCYENLTVPSDSGRGTRTVGFRIIEDSYRLLGGDRGGFLNSRLWSYKITLTEIMNLLAMCAGEADDNGGWWELKGR